MSGLFYTGYYTNAKGILENLLFGRIVGVEGIIIALAVCFLLSGRTNGGATVLAAG